MIYDAEHAFDGYKDEPDYALATWQAAEKAGADCIVPLRHQRRCLPEEIARIVAVAKRQTDRADRHPHPQRLPAWAWPTASPVSKPGATHIQGTINGYGERTGTAT